MTGIHALAEAAHLRAAELHESAAQYWETRGHPATGERERELAHRAREAAEVERQRGERNAGRGREWRTAQTGREVANF